jgi:hypothetical protein
MIALFDEEGVDTAFWFAFAGYESPHHTDPHFDLDMVSYGVCELMPDGSLAPKVLLRHGRGIPTQHRSEPPVDTRTTPPRESCAQLRDQRWFAAPVQGQMTNGVPSAVPWPCTSRHLPDPTLTTAPPDWTRHCCVAAPVQS